MPDLSALEDTLGIKFKDPSLLQQALVHSSYYNENPTVVSGSNERLEFLGDAVLGLIITERLYLTFPGSGEGEMTRLRSALVCRDTLHHVAKTLGLGDYILLGRGEEAGGGRRKPANLARALEALIAAIFLDRGFAGTKGLVLKIFAAQLDKLAVRKQVIDYKSQLQEIVQAKQQLTPTYHVIEEVGPDHIKQFTVEVRIGGKVIGTGTGNSKKAAETEAARMALQGLK